MQKLKSATRAGGGWGGRGLCVCGGGGGGVLNVAWTEDRKVRTKK